MELHKNARSCPASRLVLVDRIRGGMSVTRAASTAAISTRTAFKWKRRYQEAGKAALVDRSSPPHRMPRQVHQQRVEEVIRLRRRRYTGPQIAARVGLCYGYGCPHPCPSGLVSTQEPGTQRTRSPIPERPARRADPRRRQEVRPYRPCRSSHPWRPDEESPRHRLGVRPRRYRRCFSTLLRRGPSQ